MSRKLPLCAACGGSLRRRPKVVVEYRSIAGVPTIGWHIDRDLACYKSDPLHRALLFDSDPAPGAVEAALVELDGRGPGRLVGGDRLRH